MEITDIRWDETSIRVWSWWLFWGDCFGEEYGEAGEC